jgi:hypothetical protein
MAKVKHIGLLKFKEGTSSDQIDGIFNDLLDLSEALPGIEDYVAGPNCSGQGLERGYTHGFIMTFADQAALNAAVTHPEQQRVNGVIEPQLDSMLVFDFEV